MRKILLNSLFCLSGFYLSSIAVVANAQDDEIQPPQAYIWKNLLTLESITNFGGLYEGGTRFLGNVDATLRIDTGNAHWWKNGTFFVYALGDWGQNPSQLSGEYQRLSNIEAPNSAKIYEFWYEHSFFNGGTKILFGLHDQKESFYSLSSDKLFSESSFRLGPEMAQAEPSMFPTTSVGTLVTLTHDNLYGKIAFYDGIPGDPNNSRGTHVIHNPDDGIFRTAEFGIESKQDYKVGVGSWQQTAKLVNPVNGSFSTSDAGYYLIGEKYFDNDLDIFVRYGHADPAKNRISEYRAFGFTDSNWWMKGDEFGIAYSTAMNSPEFLKNNTDLKKSETVMEFSYLWPLTDSINAKASLYSVDHPSMLPDTKRTNALGLRLYIAF